MNKLLITMFALVVVAAYGRMQQAGHGCCRFAGARAVNQGYQTISECKRRCDRDPKCVANDVARPRHSKYHCFLFYHDKAGPIRSWHLSCGTRNRTEICYRKDLKHAARQRAARAAHAARARAAAAARRRAAHKSAARARAAAAARQRAAHKSKGRKKAAMPATANKVSYHVSKLIAKIGKSLKKEQKDYAKSKVGCAKWLKIHATTSQKSRGRIIVDKKKIAANKRKQHVIMTVTLPKAQRDGKAAQKQKDAVSRLMQSGDEKRAKEHKEFKSKLTKLNKELAFVKHLYVWLMGTKVEHRRTVKLLQTKAKEINSHAKSLSGQSAVMMETAATLMTQGHLDAIYKLLDNLRARIQQSIRRATRKELAAAKRWIREYARLRASQISWHKRVTAASVRATKASYANQKLDQAVEHLQREIEDLELKADQHERDLQVLKLRCSRNTVRHKHAVKDFISEKKTLHAVLKKVAKGKQHLKLVERHR